jgi:hypothetical protein
MSSESLVDSGRIRQGRHEAMSTQEVGGHGQQQISEKVVMREKSEVAKGKADIFNPDQNYLKYLV